MNNDIIEQIITNTKLDKKDFLSTYAKVGEETGELAKEILSYLNEPTNLHRYSTKNNIIEECVDTILTVYSLAIKAGASQDEIEDMMNIKLSKWATILQNEGRLKDINKIPYEYHCTFEFDIEKYSISILREICNKYNSKLVILEIPDITGKIYKEYMTTSNYYGKNSDAIQLCKDLANNLRNDGLNVIREKVETVPWHPLAPQNTDIIHDGYFEVHIELPIDNDINTYSLYELKKICTEFKAVFSQNVSKKYNDYYVQMVTIRKYNSCRKSIENIITNFTNNLKCININVSTPLIEFCIFDTNADLDDKWMKTT